ncbi:MAG: phospholipase D-like domain-containing protein [bacterium]
MSLNLINLTHRGLESNKNKVKNHNILTFTKYTNNNQSLPKIDNSIDNEETVSLPGIKKETASKLILAANMAHCSLDEYLRMTVPILRTKNVSGVKPENSITAKVGNCLVTSLIDGGQIFNKVQDYIQNAEKSIQIEMFEFQNKNIDGDIWPTSGAEYLPGSQEQQNILNLLIHKKKESEKKGKPLNIQVILDSHKWYQDGLGNHKRHYNNLKMIHYLKENGIDVVPYPRAVQGGTTLQHVKMLAVDGNKVILGGMNWGNHSTANHDACVAIETAPDKTNSEVDNIIDEVFNKDWKFAWQRLGHTRLIPGPLTEEEKQYYSGPKRKILAENVAYNENIAKLFDNPIDKTRYENNELNLVKVNPVKNPKIGVLVNSPREYSFIGEEGKESIGNHIKERLNTASSIKAELFVLSHKEIVQKIIERHKEAQTPGGRPFKAEILLHPGILDDFPYCRMAESLLKEAGVPIRTYKTNDEIKQRLHAKWAVFDNKEVVIGSANWSAAGLENNLDKGKRNDYPLTNDLINEEISDYSEDIKFLEERVIGEKPSFIFDGELDFETFKDNNVTLSCTAYRIKSGKLELSDKVALKNGDYVPKNTYMKYIKELSGYYKTIFELTSKKNEYRRGNHECAVVFDSPEIANTFIRQFDKDWEYSIPETEKHIDNAEQIAFKGNLLHKFAKTKEPTFNKLI